MDPTNVPDPESSESSYKRGTLMSLLPAAASIFLGVFLLVSGGAKLLDVASFVESVRALGVPYRLAYAAVFIPPLEIVMGVAFLTHTHRRLLALVFGAMLVAFTAVLAWGHYVAGAEDCGCFGQIDVLNTSAELSFLRNGILLLMAFFVFKNSPAERTEKGWKYGLTALVGSLVFAVAGMSAFQPLYEADGDQSDVIVYNGSNINSTPLSSFVNVSQDSTYLVFIYSTTCPHCWNALENVKAFQRTKTVDRVIGVSWAGKEEMAEFSEAFDVNFATTLIEPFRAGDIVSGVPRTLYVEDNTIKYVWEGHVVSPFTFRKFHSPVRAATVAPQ